MGYSQLQGLGLAKEDIPWVRFSKEDPEFNYELLSKFTYHNLNSSEGADHVDKYINDAIPWADVVWLSEDIDFDAEALLSAANDEVVPQACFWIDRRPRRFP